MNPDWRDQYLPRTFRPAAPADGPDRPRVFDPALKQYGSAFRPGDPPFPDPESARRWADARRRATDHVIRAVAESPAGDRLVLRGSRLLRAWLGAAAREPGDLDWVADPPGLRIDDPDGGRLFDAAAEAVFGRPAPPGVVFDRTGVTTDDIWTYERAPGRRVVFPWRTAGLPGGAVQADIVFGEELAEPDRRVAVPAADDGCVTVRAAGPVQSLAWKLVWLTTDSYPQGKDLYDAVLLAEQFPLTAGVLADSLRRAGESGSLPASAWVFVSMWERIDWENFRTEYPRVGGEADDWLRRLEQAIAPAFAWDARTAEPAARRSAVDPDWLTPAVVALAEGITADRAWDRLPILGDALEDAGCADEAVVGHCRAGGPHTTACWVIDALFGRGWEPLPDGR